MPILASFALVGATFSVIEMYPLQAICFFYLQFLMRLNCIINLQKYLKVLLKIQRSKRMHTNKQVCGSWQKFCLSIFISLSVRRFSVCINSIATLFDRQEFLKTTVDVADLFGLYFVMSQIAGKGQLKFMIAGVGWALAELVTTGFVKLQIFMLIRC